MGKVGNGCNFIYNTWAWIWNHFWGTVFIAVGVVLIFTGENFWLGLGGIAIGIYFYMSKRQEDKVGAIASKAATAAASAVAAEVNKERNAEIDREAATPDVMETTASESEVLSAIDAILSPTWFDLYYGKGLKRGERSGETTVYVFGTLKVPEAVRAEVRVSPHEGGTRVSFRCLHQDDSNGLRSFADLVCHLRESVEFAVAAAGDPEKVAEGVRLYGPPAPGSPAAVKARNVKIMLGVGVLICLVPAYQLAGDGIPVDELPVYLALFAVGAGVIYAATRWSKQPLAPRTIEGVVHVPVQAPTAAPADATPAAAPAVADSSAFEQVDAPAPEPGPLPLSAPAGAQAQEVAAEAAAVAAKAFKVGTGAAKSWFGSLTGKQRALVVIVAAVVVIGGGIVSAGGWPSGGLASTPDYEAYEPPSSDSEYTPPADTSTSGDLSETDQSASDEEVTTNASPMSAADAQAVIDKASGLSDLLSMYRGSSLYEIEVYWVGRVMDANRTLVFNDGEEKQWAIPFDEVKGGFYIDDQECTADEFYDMVVSGHVMPGSVGFDQNELWSVNVSTE